MQRTTVSEASLRKYPEWIVLIVVAGPSGEVNVMPAGWSMYTSFEPPMYAVSVGHERYTHHLLRAAGEFTVAVPSPGMGPAIRSLGTRSGRDGDKLAGLDLDTQPAEEIGAPLLAGALVNLECRLASELETGDHTIFVGEVLAAHLASQLSGRLLNFGPGLYALAQPLPGSEFHFEP